MSAPEHGAGKLPEMVLFKGSFSEKSHDTCWLIWWMFIQKCLEQSSEHQTAGCHTNAGSHINHIKYRLQCTPLVLFPRSMCLTQPQICSRGERDTLCVSSQVGCRLGCRFCATGHREVALSGDGNGSNHFMSGQRKGQSLG